jgi:hypothetical protein
MWEYRILAIPQDGEKPRLELRFVEGEDNFYIDLSKVWTDGVQEALNKPILWGDERFPQEYKEEK